MTTTEIVFEVTEDAVEGGYTASAVEYSIQTQGDTFEEIRGSVKGAVDCYSEDTMSPPRLFRPQFVRDEILLA